MLIADKHIGPLMPHDLKSTVFSANQGASRAMRFDYPNKSVVWANAILFVAASFQFATAQERPKNFVILGAPRVTQLSFEDGQRKKRSLADFNGKVVVLNIWATWCVPCRREMSALDRLQADLGGPEFAVVPLSIDRNGFEAVNKFYSENGIRNLPIYIDTSGKAVRELGAVGLPTTLILDRAGQEVARVVGPLDWEPSVIVEFLKPSGAAHAPSAPIQQTIRDPDYGGAS
jgi:thiol-disulfide isomerase/thioredoxin